MLTTRNPTARALFAAAAACLVSAAAESQPPLDDRSQPIGGSDAARFASPRFARGHVHGGKQGIGEISGSHDRPLRRAPGDQHRHRRVTRHVERTSAGNGHHQARADRLRLSQQTGMRRA